MTSIRDGATDLATRTTERIEMRDQCKRCGCPHGDVETRGGQDCVHCANCSFFCYNRPRSESGRDVRSTRTNAGIRPKVKARVLATHGHQCVSCGRSPALHGVVLDIDHLIPLALAERHGMLDDLTRSEVNMAPVCAECNRGKQDDLDGVSIQLIYRVLKLKQHHSA